MKNIYVLEKFDFDENQKQKLNSLGNVHYFDFANDEQIEEATKNADAILFDWIDPNKILPKLKNGQFVCLPYTGCDWVESLPEAKKCGVVVSNIPSYSTNAVAEFHLGLMLSASKSIPFFDMSHKTLGKGSEFPFLRGKELANKVVGIIGLGSIGKRLAELLKPFNVKLLTFNRTHKNVKDVFDVSLDELLKKSDYVCVTCALSESSKNMLSKDKLSLMKDDAVLTSTTGGIVDLVALDAVLKSGKLFAVGLDDVEHQEMPKTLRENKKLVCTFHRAFDTFEADKNRLDMFILNIEKFFEGKPINLI